MSQTVLITGATSGIGRHAALHLARRGHRVIATGRPAEALDALAAEAVGLPLEVVVLEVTDPDSVHNAHVAVQALTGGVGLDVLINNAGYGQAGAVLDIDDAAIRAQYETNVFGLLSVTRCFAADMVRRGTGRIINVSSVGGRISMPLAGVYTSSKFAVEALSDALRGELAPLGVQVVLIEPGAINTGFNETFLATADSVGQDGPWAEVYAGANAIVSGYERFAPGPLPVSRAITRAIEARRPRSRYLAPWYTLGIVALAARLPTSWVDAVFRWSFGLSKTRRPSSEARAAA